MAIIVNKVQKRKDIALSCTELFFKHGINDLTISQVAKTAGVGKGTIYDYFENKEDIVFEIVNILLQEHNEEKKARLELRSSTKEKIKEFFNVFHDPKKIELRNLYKQLISISLTNASEKMIEFHSNCTLSYYGWFEEIIEEGINRGELVPGAKKLARGIFAIGEGLFINCEVTNRVDNFKSELDIFFDALFELMEVKK